MNLWLSMAAHRMAWVIGFGRAPGSVEKWLVPLLGLLAGVLILKICIRGSGMPDLGILGQFAALAVAMLAVLFADIAGGIHLLPMVQAGEWITLLRIVIAVAGFLGLGVPLAAICLRGGYGKTLSSLVFAMLGMLAVMFAIHLIAGSFGAEYKGVMTIRGRTDMMDKELNRP